MINFHAVLIDETGCEFGATVRAKDHADAWEKVREDYPESRCVQMESPEDTAEREARIYERACRDYDDPFGTDYND